MLCVATLTFGYQNLIRSFLSPSGYFQICGISLEVLLRYHVHKDETDRQPENITPLVMTITSAE